MKSSCESRMNFPTVKRLVNPEAGIFRKKISTASGFSISGLESENVTKTLSRPMGSPEHFKGTNEKSIAKW